MIYSKLSQSVYSADITSPTEDLVALIVSNDVTLVDSRRRHPRYYLRWHNCNQEAACTRTEQSFLTTVAEADIRANNYDLSINRYKEIIYAHQRYDNSAELIEKIEALDKERQVDLLNLKRLLSRGEVGKSPM